MTGPCALLPSYNTATRLGRSPGLLASSRGAAPVGDWKTVRGEVAFGSESSKVCAL